MYDPAGAEVMIGGKFHKPEKPRFVGSLAQTRRT